MEIDKDIALMQSAYRENQLEEERKKNFEKYNLKKKIKYTLEEMIEGIKKGKQFLYTLKIEFDTKSILDGGLKVPYMINFFDVIDDKADTLFWVSSKRKASINATVIPWVQMKPLQDWMESITYSLEQINLHPQIGSSQTVNQMEYFSYEIPTSEGITYNLMFRYPKEGKIYSATLNCMSEDKEGMGLLLEAIIHVIEDMNH